MEANAVDRRSLFLGLVGGALAAFGLRVEGRPRGLGYLVSSDGEELRILSATPCYHSDLASLIRAVRVEYPRKVTWVMSDKAYRVLL